ncbi:hypothetical protein CAI21_08285 [Alkalilimnicola ehrlichii]|uniref:VTT domain-containing protein n=1 Tax=Alkalilimnicola ehrlichii TaxID=351052 RepID=A0A3E0WTV9_9GAMM|nr:DedA family protein [Alkalilimnicola ehrlichii]RFA29826.1 hypothetical protein CAI21_08285 [Alkalilimnicola ehrlichii]RFA36414.1 hypothetical protein CAL65_10555 [Alkalilimnicola ehrlichii]
MTVDTITHFLNEHPGWIGLALFTIVFIESLVLVGYLIPAATILLAAGALAATGHADLSAALIGATAGAVLGSTANYWVGTRFRPQLPQLWPFSKHPEMLERNRQFVALHGGKSILLSRFTKPLRPAVPAVAGMLDMNRSRFMTYNVLGSVLWAPGYLYGGFMMANSASFATTNPLQLSMLLLLLTGLIWGSYLLVKRIVASRRELSDIDLELELKSHRRQQESGKD